MFAYELFSNSTIAASGVLLWSSTFLLPLHLDRRELEFILGDKVVSLQ